MSGDKEPPKKGEAPETSNSENLLPAQSRKGQEGAMSEPGENWGRKEGLPGGAASLEKGKEIRTTGTQPLSSLPVILQSL